MTPDPKRQRSHPQGGVPPLSRGAATRAMQAHVEGGRADARYLLRLYVTGTTPRSQRAIERVRSFCEENLKGRYDLEVVDIYQLPALARDDQIIATPTLIKVLPAPLRRFIGDLSRVDKVLFGMDLRARR